MSAVVPGESLASDSALLNIAVSYDGHDLLNVGNATAESAYGGWAIAIGDGATASAGLGDGLSNFALALGSGSNAMAAAGPFNVALAYDGASAYSGFYRGGDDYSTGSWDFAAAFGRGSTANAAGEMYNTALAGWGGTAQAGYSSESSPPGHYVYPGGHIFAGAFGSDSDASGGWGDNLYALVFGDNSHAIAGGLNPGDDFHDDWALVFGNDLTADATGADGLFHFQPGDFTSFADLVAAFASELGLDWLLGGFD